MHFGELNLTVAWDIIIIFSGASRMARVSFIYDSCIRGYHEYKSIWDASVGGVLCCSREIDNPHDDHAVTVIRRGVTVGHVPRYVSRGFSLFLQLGGTITATVVSTRRYSRDLPQGGIEIPCQYTLEGPTNEVRKIRIFLASCETNYKLIKFDSEELMCSDNVIKTEPSNGKSPAKTEPNVNVLVPITTTSTTSNETIVVEQQDCVASAGEQVTEYNDTWIRLDRIVLKLDNKNILLNGLCLNDKHISYMQLLLKRQFSSVLGLKSTLIAERHGGVLPQNGLQVLLVRDNHWILLSTMDCPQGSVRIYDSAFHSQPLCVLKAITKALVAPEQIVRVSVMNMEMQCAPNDCGVYVAATMTSIAYGEDPCYLSYDSKMMRSHLARCFEQQHLIPFQSSPRVVSKVERSFYSVDTK